MANLQLKCISFGMAFVQSRNLCEVRSYLTFAPRLVPVLGVMFHVVIVKAPDVFGPQKSSNLETLLATFLQIWQPKTSTKLRGTSQWKTRWCQKHWCCLSLVASVCIRRWSPSTNFFWTRRWKFHWVPWTARIGLLWGKNGKETSKLVLKGGEAFSNRCFKVVTREAIYDDNSHCFSGCASKFSFTVLLQISAEHFRNLEKKLQLYCIHSIYHIYVYVCMYTIWQ